MLRPSRTRGSIRTVRFQMLVVLVAACTLTTGFLLNTTTARAQTPRLTPHDNVVACANTTDPNYASNCTITVSVIATGVQGTPTTPSPWPAAGSYSLQYSEGADVQGESMNVQGTLSCTTLANASSPPGAYPLTSCSGLTDSINPNVIVTITTTFLLSSTNCQALTATTPNAQGFPIPDNPSLLENGGLVAACGSSYIVAPAVVCAANPAPIRSVTNNSDGTTITITFLPPFPPPPPSGSEITVAGITPTSYDGTYTVSSSGPDSVTYFDSYRDSSSPSPTFKIARVLSCPTVTVTVTASSTYGTETNGAPTNSNLSAPNNWLGPPPPINTKVLLASNGEALGTLPGTTLNVASTNGFPSSGDLTIISGSGGSAVLTYSSIVNSTSVNVSTLQPGNTFLNVATDDVVTVQGSLMTVEIASDGSNQSGNVSGSLSCQTTANSNGTSPVGVYTLPS